MRYSNWRGKKTLFPAGFEPATLCVWSTRDNRYTKETRCVNGGAKMKPSHLGIEPRTFGLEVQRAIRCANGTPVRTGETLWSYYFLAHNNEWKSIYGWLHWPIPGFLHHNQCVITVKMTIEFDEKKSFEPDLNQRPMDFWHCIRLQSTALPTELSKELWNIFFSKIDNSDYYTLL